MAAARENIMTIIIWPWASWLLGFSAIVAAAIIVVVCKKNNVLTKGILAAIIILVVVGLTFLLFGYLEVFEGNRSNKVFLIRKIALCRSKVHKLKWSQIKRLDATMSGELTNYNNSIHYVIEFETITGGRIHCLETSDRKEIKQRVGKTDQILFIKMFMGKDYDSSNIEVQNKTQNKVKFDEHVRLSRLQQM